MIENDFGSWLDRSTPALKAWGAFVVQRISELVKVEIGDERYSTFFKITPSARVKQVPSAVAKQRKKAYPSPQEDMTDLVGARFVVLVRTDIEIVERALMSYTGWTFSRDRHFKDEVSADPELFDYQSVHYVIRLAEDLEIEGLTIAAETACEVQIRTLLQHAYAELVHDNIYKPNGSVPPSAKRLVARCMALMETTDDMFCQALHELEQVNTSRDDWLLFIGNLHEKIVGQVIHPESNLDSIELLDTYRDLLEGCNRAELEAMLLKDVYIRLIRPRAEHVDLFGRPMCVLVYWLVKHHDRETIERWPFPRHRQGLAQIYADLGFSTGGTH